MNKKHLIKALKRVLSKEEEILFAYLYGSYAQGTNIPESDVDLALYFKSTNLKTYLNLERKLLSTLISELHTDKIEIVVLNTLPFLMKYKVLKEGIPVLIKDEQARADFDDSIMNRYFELKPYLDEYKRVLFFKLT